MERIRNKGKRQKGQCGISGESYSTIRTDQLTKKY